ncbi:MAG: UDP-N-acetylmuramoyl-L-alanyl-D-glutamate--2,6-diaminopimelate ligase, partial [Deltaproteobacteria bacterium]
MKVVGITGTNGKTTVAFLLRDIFRQAGYKVAMLGTVCYETISGSIPARITTPGADELAEMMRETVRAGGTHMVMEVSSHALDQHRIEGIDFSVAVFTNISGDHLDYHGSMEDYFKSKSRLFEMLHSDTFAILNRDEPMSESLAAITKAAVVWYGLSSASDVFGRIDSIDITGGTFTVRVDGAETAIRTNLIGRHNIYNCLAAIAAARSLGVGLGEIIASIEQLRYVPGRVQRVDIDAPFTVLVDYAHTDDALSKVLSALRPLSQGRLILLFGCGGNRDKTKRPRMARVAQR